MTNIAIGWMLADLQGRPHMISTDKGPILEVNMSAPPVFGEDSPVMASQVRVLPAVPGWLRGPVDQLGVLEIPLPPGTNVTEEIWNKAIKDSGIAETIRALEHLLIATTAGIQDSPQSDPRPMDPSPTPSEPTEDTGAGEPSETPAAAPGN